MEEVPEDQKVARLHREQLSAAIKRLEEDDWPSRLEAWLRSSLDAFYDMQDRDHFPLTDKQHAWVERVAEVLDFDLPAPPRQPVPRGREVALLVNAMPKPKTPPGRKLT